MDEVQLVILDVTLLESRSAIRRREREGDILGEDAGRILQQIDADSSSIFLVQLLTSAVIEEAARLIDRHLLRAYDALQLAGCLVVRHSPPGPLTFVCADVRLCEAGSLEGLTVLNPVSPGAPVELQRKSKRMIRSRVQVVNQRERTDRSPTPGAVRRFRPSNRGFETDWN